MAGSTERQLRPLVVMAGNAERLTCELTGASINSNTYACLNATQQTLNVTNLITQGLCCAEAPFGATWFTFIHKHPVLRRQMLIRYNLMQGYGELQQTQL